MNENTINNDVTIAGRESVLASRYRIIKQLGQGGMGSVWLAEDTQLDGKFFAIKMLPSILVSNKRAYQQLKAEALVAMKLVHPNIVQIRAFEENNNNPFLVMDYIDGETLDDWLGERGIGNGEEDIIRLLKPIAEAIDYAHSEGVVHRDIKPANVMIRKDGRPFIMDFGIAREIQETMTRVTGKMSSGTLMYMSPEQLNGDMPKPSQDVYSFAAMVYECLKGEPPFCRGAIEDQIKNKAPEVLGDDITVASSVMSGLSKRPEDRPKTCADVLKVNSNTLQSSSKNREVWPGRSPLREAKSLEACERPREPQSVQAMRTTSGEKVFGKIAAVGLLAMGLAAGLWYWQDVKAKEEARIAEEQKAEAERKAAEEARRIAEEKAKKEKAELERKQREKAAKEAESRVADIMSEAMFQKDCIARIDDADGFERRKAALSDLLTKATSYGKVKQWDKAALNYTNYVEGCKALLALNNERNLADKNRKIAEAAKVGAEGADSAKYVSVQWNEALANAKIAGEKFAAMEFAKASHLYEKAAGQFLECERNAKKECARLKQEEEQREEALREKERLAAVAARSFALKESKRAEEEGAKQYAVDSWNRIVADWKSADDLLKEKRYAEAKNKFDEIAKAYVQCIEDVGRAKRRAEEQRIENERLKEEKRKAMRQLPGKWECQTESTTMGASTKLNYIYEFQENGSYVNVMKHSYGGRVITTGTWLLTGTTLLLNDSGTTQSYSGNVGGKIYKHTNKREPVSVRYNILWREDGTFELRYADVYWKNGENEVSVSYDSDGKCHHKCRIPGGFLRSETTYETVETAKVFRRVK